MPELLNEGAGARPLTHMKMTEAPALELERFPQAKD